MFYQFFQLLKSIFTNLSNDEKDKIKAVLIMIIIIIFIIIMLFFTNNSNKIKQFQISPIYNNKNYIKIE